MTTFDPSLLPEGCGACQQRVVKVDGRCPICATQAEQARAAARPAVPAGPWPRVRVGSVDLRVATVAEVGSPPAARLEPDLATPGSMLVTALVDGVRADGTSLPVGRRTRVDGGARLELPASTEVP